jgi:uncharacterized protein (TIGR03000 family)
MSWTRLFPALCLTLLFALTPVNAVQDKEPGDKKTADQDAKSATIRVKLPASAKLVIDDYETTSTGTERLFVTPPLHPDKTFAYTLKATWPSDNPNRAIVRMAVAKVQAGKQTVIDMNQNSKDASSSQIIYVPTAQVIVDKMLEMAQVTKDDVVYDLGCGDARILVTAARKFGARGVGVDIDPDRIKDSLANVKKEKVEALVEIRQGDALKVPDLSKATVVTLYMLPEFMEKLKPILLRDLKPGTRIVSHNYTLPGWTPRDSAKVQAQGSPFAATVYLWHVPAKKE